MRGLEGTVKVCFRKYAIDGAFFFSDNDSRGFMDNGIQLDTIVLAVMVAGIMPIICAGIAKWGRKDYDNHHPRDWYQTLEGRSARAYAAQQNCFEAFPFFAVAVVLAALSGADGDLLERLCWLFVVARVVYIACYLADKAAWRSTAWLIGYGCVLSIFTLALF